MKTTIQKFFDYLKESGTDLKPKLREQFLGKEKQVIIDACDFGLKLGWDNNQSGKKYYKEKFKTQ